MDGVKGKTWGPSSIKQDRNSQRSSWSLASANAGSRGAPNIEKTLTSLATPQHRPDPAANIVKELGEFDDDDWPENLDQFTKSEKHIQSNGTETPIKRYAVRKPTDNMLYMMAAIMAGKYAFSWICKKKDEP